MIDFHTHTILSDGELIASELVWRAQTIGYKAIGLTDHVDYSNIDFVIPRLVKVSEVINSFWKIKVIPGVEISYTPLEKIPELVKFARSNGAKIVIVHGESPREPVIPGTNKVAIESGVNILAHPGFITKDEVKLAKDNGVYLELTTRNGHSEGNKHVSKIAQELGASLILNTDTHSDSDLVTEIQARKFLKGLKLKPNVINLVLKNSEILLESILEKKL